MREGILLAEQQQLDAHSERLLADRLMSIAESRSVRALGVACCSAIGELTGSPTVGLYLLEGAEPDLVYSRHVAEGLLDNYKSGFWKCDPVLDCILTAGRTIDGASLLGPHHWRHSASCEMLHEWGFSYNMGGPLRCENRIVGVLFTATRDAAAPYTPLVRQRMDMLCRAGSLALTNMMNTGQIDEDAGAFGDIAAALGGCRDPGLPWPDQQGDRARDGHFGPDRERTRRQSVQALRRPQPHRTRGLPVEQRTTPIRRPTSIRPARSSIPG